MQGNNIRVERSRCSTVIKRAFVRPVTLIVETRNGPRWLLGCAPPLRVLVGGSCSGVGARGCAMEGTYVELGEVLATLFAVLVAVAAPSHDAVL